MITITIDDPKLEEYFHHSEKEVLDFLTLNDIDDVDRKLVYEVESDKELQEHIKQAKNGDMKNWTNLNDV